MTEPNLKSEPCHSAVRTSRRSFLKGTAALASTLLVSGMVAAPGKAMAGGLTGWPNRYGMLSDLTKCTGCRRCEAACNRVNKLPAPSTSFEDESVFAAKRRPDAKALTVVNRYSDGKTPKPIYRKVQCNHCEEPACASACLVGAMKKTPEGPVVYNAEVCIGCRYCMVACPFHVPAYDYASAFEPKVQKCNMCYDRISQGLVPACAEACPVEAITFGKRSQLLAIARERVRSQPNGYVDHIFGEKEAGGTGWLYLAGIPFEKLGFETEVETVAYPELTKEFLSFVPLVLVAWPSLLGGIHLMSRRRQEAARAETGDLREEEIQR